MVRRVRRRAKDGRQLRHIRPRGAQALGQYGLARLQQRGQGIDREGITHFSIASSA